MIIKYRDLVSWFSLQVYESRSPEGNVPSLEPAGPVFAKAGLKCFALLHCESEHLMLILHLK